MNQLMKNNFNVDWSTMKNRGQYRNERTNPSRKRNCYDARYLLIAVLASPAHHDEWDALRHGLNERTGYKQRYPSDDSETEKKIRQQEKIVRGHLFDPPKDILTIPVITVLPPECIKPVFEALVWRKTGFWALKAINARIIPRRHPPLRARNNSN
jgi:hypothetical protein